MKKLFAELILVVCILVVSISHAENLPAGYIGAVQCCNTPGQYSTYTYSFTPTQSGSDFVLFAFRQDPAYWSFGNVQVNLLGNSTNLVLNGNMQYGGGISVSTNSGTQYIQAPTHWGVVYQNGTYPAAAGTWSGSGGPQGVGQWYDGAVGSFDGIYQGVSVVAGQTYNVSFQALSTYGVANTSSIQIGVYAGGCANLGLSPANCTPNSSAGFTSIATPAQTGTAGGVTVTGNTTTTVQSTITAPGTPIVTTTYPLRTANAVVNGQAVIETFTDTLTSTVTPITTTVYSTPTTVTTYSDGTSVTTTGIATVVSTSTTNSSPVVVVTQATVPTTIVPAYSSNITAVEQSRVNAANNRRTGISGNGIYIQQSGNSNTIAVDQVGTNQQVSGNGSQMAPIQGNNNQIIVRQGDTINRMGQSLVELSVYGDANALNINQSRDVSGNSLGTDQGGHYQSIKVSGSINTVNTSQTGADHYAEVNITGNNNNQSLVQTGTSQQAFTVISGNSNSIDTTQSGAGHFLDISLTGDGNSATVNQSGSTQNRATISLTNAGGASSVNLTQNGGQVYSISQTCVTSGGCGTVVVRQSN